MKKILTSITLSLALLFTFIVPVFALEQQQILQDTASVLAIDQTYTEWTTQKGVPVNKVWSIKFNSPILASTVNDQNVYVVDSSGQKHNITLTLASDTKTIQVTPSGNYKSGESYTLNILKGLSSASQNSIALKSNIRMQFAIVGTAVTVQSINASNVTTTAGTTPVLPTTVTALMSDGTTKTVNVTWANVTASQYASAGTFVVSGTIAESSTVKALANVTVVKLGATISTISWDKGTYTGEVENHIPNGNGTWIGDNGYKFVGTWLNGYNYNGTYYNNSGNLTGYVVYGMLSNYSRIDDVTTYEHVNANSKCRIQILKGASTAPKLHLALTTENLKLLFVNSVTIVTDNNKYTFTPVVTSGASPFSPGFYYEVCNIVVTEAIIKDIIFSKEPVLVRYQGSSGKRDETMDQDGIGTFSDGLKAYEYLSQNK